MIVPSGCVTESDLIEWGLAKWPLIGLWGKGVRGSMRRANWWGWGE